jgi:hypothetical protein
VATFGLLSLLGYWPYFPESPRTQVEKQLTAVRHNCTVVLVGVIDLHLESGIYAGAIGNIGLQLGLYSTGVL